jgi:hypothetical protein
VLVRNSLLWVTLWATTRRRRIPESHQGGRADDCSANRLDLPHFRSESAALQKRLRQIAKAWATARKMPPDQEPLKGILTAPVAAFVNSSPRFLVCWPNAFICVCMNSV